METCNSALESQTKEIENWNSSISKKEVVMLKIEGKYTSALITTDNVDEKSMEQVTALTNHPSFTNPIVMMPDIHAGAGAPIGFTMELSDSIVPNIVGVDIGCALLGCKIKRPTNMDLKELNRAIRKKIPFSTNVRESGINGLKHGDAFYTQAQSGLDSLWMRLREKFGVNVPKPQTITHDWYINKCSQIGMNFERAQRSIGTLGGGK